MGILLLPSLEEKRHIRLENISKTEAVLFIKNLDERVKDSRSLKIPKETISDSYKEYRLIDDIGVFDIEELLEELGTSDVPQHRGIRSVFVDEETDLVIVGTTIVYSANWAMLGFDDVTIDKIILDYNY